MIETVASSGARQGVYVGPEAATARRYWPAGVPGGMVTVLKAAHGQMDSSSTVSGATSMSGRLLSMIVTLPAALQSPLGKAQPGVMAPPAGTEARPGGGCVMYTKLGAVTAAWELGEGMGVTEGSGASWPPLPVPLVSELELEGDAEDETLGEAEDDADIDTLMEREDEGETDGEGEMLVEALAVVLPPPLSLSPVPLKLEPEAKAAEPETVAVEVLVLDAVLVVVGVCVLVAKLD